MEGEGPVWVEEGSGVCVCVHGGEWGGWLMVMETTESCLSDCFSFFQQHRMQTYLVKMRIVEEGVECLRGEEV